MTALGAASRASDLPARRVLVRGVVQQRRAARAGGFTLIEAMIVVCILAVLASLATYGVRKYVLAAKTTEPLEIINSIRAAEESYKDETFGYKRVSAITGVYYPWGGVTELKDSKRSWEVASSPIQDAFTELGVHPSAPVQFGYACDAGKAAQAVPTPAILGISKSLGFPTTAADWFVARAAGDRNGNGVLATFVGSSFTDETYGENETE